MVSLKVCDCSLEVNEKKLTLRCKMPSEISKILYRFMYESVKMIKLRH